MKVTGVDLNTFYVGVQELMAQIKNRIATCPAPSEHAAELEALRNEVKHYRKLLGRIHNAITFETAAAKRKEAAS